MSIPSEKRAGVAEILTYIPFFEEIEEDQISRVVTEELAEDGTMPVETLMYRSPLLGFVEDAYVSEHDMEVILKVNGDVKHLRIDPAMDSCVCRIVEFTFNGEDVPFSNRKAVTINGRMAGKAWCFLQRTRILIFTL